MDDSDIYGRELVDLRNQSRWEFLNTFFSVSEALAYAQVTYNSSAVLTSKTSHMVSTEKF